jgi:hypothetical protein
VWWSFIFVRPAGSNVSPSAHLGTGSPSSNGASRLPMPTIASPGSGVDSTCAQISSAAASGPSAGTRRNGVRSR